MLHRYEDAVQAVSHYGILPLTNAVPDHPSIDSLAPEGVWHTNLPSDPWLWRFRFPVEGTAAYGKFMKQKSILVAPDLFPYLKALLDDGSSVKQRYRDGRISRETVTLLEVLEEAGELDTRELRGAAGLKAKDRKADYDRGLLALQESMDVVISGVNERTKANGEKNGWSSMFYTTAERWMMEKNIPLFTSEREEAEDYTRDRLSKVCSPKAMEYFSKLYRFSY